MTTSPVFTVAAPMTLSDVVAQNLKLLMATRRVTQAQLADVLGISQAGVSARMRGRTPFDVNELGSLARAFGVRPADLVRVDGGFDGLPQLDSNQQPAGYTASPWYERVAA